MLPTRSPGPSRGPAAVASFQQGIQPVTWATLPRAAQVLGLLALVHLLAVLITSLHSHSHGGGVVLFPLASLFTARSNLGPWQAPGAVPTRALEATEEARIARADAEDSTVRARDEQAGRQLPDPATNLTRSQTSNSAGGADGAAAALDRQKDDLTADANVEGKQRRAELDRIISERRQRLGTNAQQVSDDRLATGRKVTLNVRHALETARAKEQVAMLQREQDLKAAEGVQAFMGRGPGKQVKAAASGETTRSEPRAVPMPARPGLMSALLGRGDSRPLADRLADVVIDWVELRGDRPVPKPKVDFKAIEEQEEKAKKAREQAEAAEQAKQAQQGGQNTVTTSGTKWRRRKKRPSKKDLVKAAPSLPAIKSGSCEAELSIPKVAMMFLTRGHLYHEEMWAAWFRVASELLPQALVQAQGCSEDVLQRIALACAVPGSAATVLQQQRLFSVYIHVGQDNAEFNGFPQGSIWHERSIPERIKVEWGQHSMVDATRALLRNALHDPLNQKFILLSEAGIPLYPPAVLYHQLMTEDKSRLHACVTPTWERHVHRWIDRMANEHLNKDNWRKSSQWFALTRAHAQLVVDDTIIDGIFRKDCYPTREDGWWRDCFGDEHYMATLLAALGREDETDCHGYLTNVDWSRGGGHPRSYLEREVSAARIRLLRLPAKECGYPAAIRTAREHFLNASSLSVDACSAAPVQYAPLGPQCPLLARKFPVETAQAVLRLLSDCKNRLKVLFLEDCRRHHRRRLLDDWPDDKGSVPGGDEAVHLAGALGVAGGSGNASAWAALDQMLESQDGLEPGRVEVAGLLQQWQAHEAELLEAAWRADDQFADVARTTSS